MYERKSNSKYRILLDGQEMESVRTFKYLGIVMSKDGGMDDELKREPNKGKRVVGTLRAVTRNRRVGNEIKKSLYDSTNIDAD